MVNKDWRFSSHARYYAWEHRFAEYDIKDAINRSVLFGGQLGTDSLYHDSVSNAVFVVTKDGWVKTVLTYDMAIANMMAFSKVVSKLEFVKAKVEIKPATLPIKKSSSKPDTYYDNLDHNCFKCAKYIYDNYTKEEFESSVKNMSEVTKSTLKKFELRSKQYCHEWHQVHKYIYQLWKGEVSSYNDVAKQLQKV